MDKKDYVIEIPEGMTPLDLGYEEDDGSMGEPDSVEEVVVDFIPNEK